MKIGPWTHKLIAGTAVLLIGAACAADDNEPNLEPLVAARAAFDRAVEADGAGDEDQVIEHLETAATLFPQSPRYRYNLARTYAAAGRKRDALTQLEAYAQMGFGVSAGALSAFAGLDSIPAFGDVSEHMRLNLEPTERSEIAFRFGPPDLLTEGIAFDPVENAFFVGSVHHRRITRRSADNEMADFFGGDDRQIWSPMGMLVDAGGRMLWVAASAVSQGLGTDSASVGHASIYQVDLDDGRLVAEYVVSNEDGRHWIGDLTVSQDGVVYATDSQTGAVYRIVEGELETWVLPGTLRSPQGLALSGDEQQLFVADYSYGIVRINTDTGAITRVDGPDWISTVGIDGLYRHGDALIAIQNGTSPSRVIRLNLADGGRRFGSLDVLEANHELFHDPTLGVIVGDTLYYVANSQWPSFGEDGATPPEDELTETTILGVSVTPS